MWIKPGAIALLVLPFIGGCFAKPFQPPPAEATLWQKRGASEQDVVRSMLACGERDGSGFDPNATLEQQAERFECMKRAGYVRRNGFDFCALDTRHEIKACDRTR